MRPRAITGAIAIGLCVAALHAQTSGVIDGTVVSTDEPPRPIRNATVEITGHGIVERVLTNDAGEFRFSNLAPDRYVVAAAKAAYLRTQYGAKEIGGAGTPIVLTAASPVRLTIPLARGSVLTGVIRQYGRPLPEVVVTAKASDGIDHAAWTNHEGEFRVYGLPPGDYVLDAKPPIGFRPGDIAAIPLKSDVVDAVLAKLPAAVAGKDFSSLPLITRDWNLVKPVGVNGYAPVYFPGTLDRGQAVAVKLGLADERGGLDFDLILGGTARIRGQVVGPDGTLPTTATVTAMGAGGSYSTSANGGTFETPGVPPGHYTLEARTIEGWGPGGAPDLSLVKLTWWALADVDVAGSGVDGVVLTLQPPMTFSGRVILQGAQTTVGVGTRVTLRRAGRENDALLTVSSVADARGAFQVTGIGPGPYTLEVSGGAVGADPLWFRSAIVGGRDLLDSPLEFGTTTKSLADVAITLTNRHTTVSGTLRGVSGQTASGYHIVLFSTAANDWHPSSRRVVATRPADDGSFAFRDVPPGDYYVAALSTRPADWRTPTFLSSIVSSAVRLTLQEGGRVTQDLRLAR